jgi:hypothetical protein
MQNAFYPRDTLSRRLGLDPLRLRNCAQVAGIRLDGQYAVSMSQATPMPAEPPTPSAQQLAQWRALVERIRQGDRSQVVAWDETSAADTGATYQVLVSHRVPSAASRCPAVPGRHCRRHYRGPSGGSDRSQHDLPPAWPWRCWVDGDLWRHSGGADLLGPPRHADDRVAQSDLGGMTNQNGRHAHPGAEAPPRGHRGTPNAVSLQPVYSIVVAFEQTIDQLLCWRRILSGLDHPQARVVA